MTDKNYREMSVTFKSQAEAEAEREAERTAYRQRDILERLKAKMQSRYIDDNYHVDVADAAAEIEWLRAERPDAVTRGELNDMADGLRQMQATISAMLERIEKGARPAENTGQKQEQP